MVYKPYDPAIESPLLVNRKKWKLFANYTPIEGRPEEDTWIVKLNTTEQYVEIHDPELVWLLYYIRVVHPGATPEEAVNHELAEVEKDGGKFKNDDELIGYAMYLYTALAIAIAYGLLVVVE
ncbi:hypothetical protein [Saccharolobus solfataricus]|uniref:hypothetical protein n=1 Tax=Saccharolobus solfataricus TaxID=2287 RepID=UPI001E4ADD90|nr:hypothetical protein [Saccharolobus solfataricus]